MPVLVPAAPETDPRPERELIPAKTVLTSYLQEITTTPNKAGDGFYLKLKVETDNSGAYPRRWLWSNVSLKPTARWKLREFLRALGYTAEQVANTIPIDVCDGRFEDVSYPVETPGPLAPLLVDISLHVGQAILIEVGTQTYEGKTGNTISAFLPQLTDPDPNFEIPF